MPRFLAAVAIVCSALSHAALLPEQLGGAKRSTPPQTISIPAGDALAAELGLDAAEEADYAAAPAPPQPALKFHIAAWRLKDPTSAYAYFLATRDKAAAKSKFEKIAVSEADGSTYFTRGNYVLRVKGWNADKAALDKLFAVLPRLDQSGLPTLPAYLPEGRSPNSDRFIIGPACLERFESRISPGMAAFSMGAEAVSAKYEGGGSLIIFNYPTPEIARGRVEEFRKLPGIAVKRTGPLVAAVLDAPDANTSEQLLAKVNYQATLTWNEVNPEVEVKRSASFLVSAFTLAGVLMLMCVGAGVAFGLIRVAHRAAKKGQEEEVMIRLDLDTK